MSIVNRIVKVVKSTDEDSFLNLLPLLSCRFLQGFPGSMNEMWSFPYNLCKPYILGVWNNNHNIANVKGVLAFLQLTYSIPFRHPQQMLPPKFVGTLQNVKLPPDLFFTYSNSEPYESPFGRRVNTINQFRTFLS